MCVQLIVQLVFLTFLLLKTYFILNFIGSFLIRIESHTIFIENVILSANSSILLNYYL